jgi:hypothetical protein
MSTHATPTTEPQTTDTTTSLTSGRWQSADEPPPSDPDAPLTFDGRCRYRLPNGVDAANQYDGRRC